MEKLTTFSLLPNEGLEVLDAEIVKTASFVLPDGVDYDPDYLYMIVRAVSAGEYWGPNKNLDYFPEKELLASFKTFLSAHTFKNHENKHIENAIGDVIKAEWNDKMKCVELLIRIDRRIAPTIVRGFEKGFMTDVSMGCRIDHSICSICGNKAKTRYQFCEHIKSMKGKVFDDGRKVYEINIAPKFHDISAVLNGAEKCAKVLNLYIHNSKITAQTNKSASKVEESMEKVASFQNFISEDEIKTMRKQADEIMADAPLFEKTASDKRSFAEKLAEAKEELKGRVVEKAVEEVGKKGHQSLDKISDIINLLYTDYWDKKKCNEIGEKLRLLSKDKGKSPEDTFNQFLRVLDFAGIRISPLELGDIYTATTGGKTPDLRQLSLNKETPEQVIQTSNKALSEMNSNEINVPSVCRAIKIINNSDMSFDENPKAKLVGLTVKVNRTGINPTSDDLEDIIMNKIVSSLMEARSNHPRFLMPRMESILNGEVKPREDYLHHHAPVKILDSAKKMEKHGGIKPFLLSGMMHVAYENDRVERLKNGELNKGIHKFAHYIDGDFIEKTAKSATGLAIATIPLTMSYSALQRSRINNGEDISSLNRFTAENPGNTAFLVSAGTKIGAKTYKKQKKKIIKGLRNITKKADEDFFKSAELDDIMLKKGYTPKQLTMLKKACLMMEIDTEAADSIMKTANINEDDLGNYLQEASNCITIDIEKYANVNGFGNILKDSVVADAMFRNNKGPLAASLPGYVVDGLALAGISKGVEKLLSGKEKNTDV